MARIMVVEDSTTMRSLISATIEEIEGMEVVQAVSGFEALRILPQSRIDLIITDINMPDINGLEIVHFIRSNPHYRAIPIVIVTTEQAEEDRKKGLALGASEYLTKPFRPEHLQDIVKRFVQGEKEPSRGKA
jgi:two-component system chemotaxis response regulator CheY